MKYDFKKGDLVIYKNSRGKIVDVIAPPYYQVEISSPELVESRPRHGKDLVREKDHYIRKFKRLYAS